MPVLAGPCCCAVRPGVASSSTIQPSALLLLATLLTLLLAAGVMAFYLHLPTGGRLCRHLHHAAGRFRALHNRPRRQRGRHAAAQRGPGRARGRRAGQAGWLRAVVWLKAALRLLRQCCIMAAGLPPLGMACGPQPASLVARPASRRCRTKAGVAWACVPGPCIDALLEC